MSLKLIQSAKLTGSATSGPYTINCNVVGACVVGGATSGSATSGSVTTGRAAPPLIPTKVNQTVTTNVTTAPPTTINNTSSWCLSICTGCQYIPQSKSVLCDMENSTAPPTSNVTAPGNMTSPNFDARSGDVTNNPATTSRATR